MLEKHGKILAIIAAREGSKGLPEKNILDCAGKPLIAWTIETALKSKCIDTVLVSTDSKKIADISLEYGAWVPFLRSPDLAEDESSIIDVINDVITRLDALSHDFDYVMLLQPTSPLRTTEHIDQAVEKYFSSKASDQDTLISVKKIDNKLLWALGQDAVSGYVYNHCNVDLSDNSRRQALPDCYMPNGAIYLARVNEFKGFYSDHTRAYVMDDISSTDIDCQKDLNTAAEYLNKK